MTFTKEDKRDLLKLADIIEKKEFFNRKNKQGYLEFSLPEDKRDGNQFNLGRYYFNCGMPACAAGHSVCEFPNRFPDFVSFGVDRWIFANAFNISDAEAFLITDPSSYRGENPTPKIVANRIRMIVKRQEIKP